jgi:hypothetical protein
MMTFLREQWSRVTAGIALAAVAVATGVISYRHIYELSIALHQPPIVARLQPVGIDGLIVVGSVVLLQASPNHPYLGWFGVVPGALVSLFANFESGIAYGWLAAAWAGVPAAGFALATFLLERWLKDQVGRGGSAGSQWPVNGGESPLNGDPVSQCAHGVARSLDEAVTMAFLHGRDCLGDAPSIRQLSAAFDRPRPRVSALVGSLNGNGTAHTNGGTP